MDCWVTHQLTHPPNRQQDVRGNQFSYSLLYGSSDDASDNDVRVSMREKLLRDRSQTRKTFVQLQVCFKIEADMMLQTNLPLVEDEQSGEVWYCAQ